MIANLIQKSVKQSVKDVFGREISEINVGIPPEEKFGDYATSVALTLAKDLGLKPQEVAEKLTRELENQRVRKDKIVEKIEIVFPGFINFFLSKGFLQRSVEEILRHGKRYGEPEKKFKMQNSKCKVQTEFISANPTGPLHAGNGRGGFGGDVLARVLEKQGYKVQREYYINDRGVQVEKLAKSVELRLRELSGERVDFTQALYPGAYVRDIARVIKKTKLKKVDFKEFALAEIMKLIKNSIKKMGIKFDRFFSEQSLYDKIEGSLKVLDQRGLTYKKDGALWFASSKFGDDKDRVLVKSDGEMTYFVSDIAYHLEKFEARRFDKVILLWGADHHGYVRRFQAMVEALGHKGKADIIIIQLLKIIKEGREVRMSKRTGEYITLDDILESIGLDAARFHFLLKPFETPMVLDLDLAKKKSADNPVFYVQYAHARMSSIIRKSKRKAQSSKLQLKTQNFELLGKSEELRLIKKLIQLPDLLEDVSRTYRVHLLPYYSIELADLFHKFYEQCRVLSDDRELTEARLALVLATKFVLKNTLDILGVSAPDRM